MSRRDVSDVWESFGKHFDSPDRDLQAAIWEVYMLGFKDGELSRQRRRRANRSAPKSDRMQETAARALMFVQRTAKWKNISPTLLVSGRDSATVRERQETYYVLRELPGRPFSFPIIALAFGLKDHSAVVHGCNKVEGRIANDPGLGTRLRNLTRRVGAAA